MAVTAKVLINSKNAASSATTEYTTPVGTRTIVDSFTATNTDASARTLSVYLVPSGGSAGASNLIIKELSIAAGETKEVTSLQKQILAAGDVISVLASVASVVVIRASGREVT